MSRQAATVRPGLIPEHAGVSRSQQERAFSKEPCRLTRPGVFLDEAAQGKQSELLRADGFPGCGRLLGTPEVIAFAVCGDGMNAASELARKFQSRFGTQCEVYRAPGRVNLIGEHTDYNEGFVLPAAIEFSCWTAIQAREDRKLVVYSENFDETAEAHLDTLPARGGGKWFDYPMGVARALEREGKRLSGANLYIRGEVPFGAGLSSSAAVEVCVGYALLNSAKLPFDLWELARLSQRAENEFVGARCGIMDQFISCFGRAGHALLLDCRSLVFEPVPIPREVHLVICNTMVKHELSFGEYNARREECEEAVRRLRGVMPEIRALRDATAGQLEQHRGRLGEKLYRRSLHVVTENDRARRAAAALKAGDLSAVGPLFAGSHRSLRDNYEVSCPELDLMVELAEGLPGVRGARMTGGGFGGCTINLVDAAHSHEFRSAIAEKYAAKTGLRPEVYICKAGDGVGASAGTARESEVSAGASDA